MYKELRSIENGKKKKKKKEIEKTLSIYLKNNWLTRTSLVVQWLRVCLPMQGTQVQSLVQEDPAYCRATKPVYHSCWSLYSRA